MLVCGDYDYHPDDPRDQTITNPAIVVEVLSDSTAEDDETDEFDHYRLAPSLTDYVLIAQNEQRVEVRTRKGDRFEVTTHGPGERVELTDGVRWTVDELYAR